LRGPPCGWDQRRTKAEARWGRTNPLAASACLADGGRGRVACITPHFGSSQRSCLTVDWDCAIPLCDFIAICPLPFADEIAIVASVGLTVIIPFSSGVHKRAQRNPLDFILSGGLMRRTIRFAGTELSTGGLWHLSLRSHRQARHRLLGRW